MQVSSALVDCSERVEFYAAQTIGLGDLLKMLIAHIFSVQLPVGKRLLSVSLGMVYRRARYLVHYSPSPQACHWSVDFLGRIGWARTQGDRGISLAASARFPVVNNFN